MREVVLEMDYDGGDGDSSEVVEELGGGGDNEDDVGGDLVVVDVVEEWMMVVDLVEEEDDSEGGGVVGDEINFVVDVVDVGDWRGGGQPRGGRGSVAGLSHRRGSRWRWGCLGGATGHS